MNIRQRQVLIAVAIIVAVMLLFPPYHVFHQSARALVGSKLLWGWLFSLPRGSQVEVGLLFAQWAAVSVIGTIAYFLFSDKR